MINPYYPESILFTERTTEFDYCDFHREYADIIDYRSKLSKKHIEDVLIAM